MPVTLLLSKPNFKPLSLKLGAFQTNFRCNNSQLNCLFREVQFQNMSTLKSYKKLFNENFIILIQNFFFFFTNGIKKYSCSALILPAIFSSFFLRTFSLAVYTSIHIRVHVRIYLYIHRASYILSRCRHFYTHFNFIVHIIDTQFMLYTRSSFVHHLIGHVNLISDAWNSHLTLLHTCFPHLVSLQQQRGSFLSISWSW